MMDIEESNEDPAFHTLKAFQNHVKLPILLILNIIILAIGMMYSFESLAVVWSLQSSLARSTNIVQN